MVKMNNSMKSPQLPDGYIPPKPPMPDPPPPPKRDQQVTMSSQVEVLRTPFGKYVYHSIGHLVDYIPKRCKKAKETYVLRVGYNAPFKLRFSNAIKRACEEEIKRQKGYKALIG